jgi:hypothetical protein
MTTRKVAIIVTSERYHDYDNYDRIINSITDWSEVTEDEYKTLVQASHVSGFRVLERPSDERAFIENTVASYLEAAQEAKKRSEREKAEREAATLQRRLKKEAKTKEQRLKLLQELKQEFPEAV